MLLISKPVRGDDETATGDQGFAPAERFCTEEVLT